MHDFGFVHDLVIVLGVALVVVTGFRRLRLPSIAGFILAGALVGPGGLSWVGDSAQVHVLAEVGVMLLLFGIGIELSLNRIRRLWRLVLVGGALQVGLTTGLTSGLGAVLGLDPAAAVFVGFVVAVSSTAVVLRGLSKLGELESAHGRLALGILVFQDLCVVPMILAIPLLAGDGDLRTGLFSLGRAGLLIAAVLLAARFVVPPLLQRVAATRERELFVVTVFLLCFGTAWAAQLAGVSLALGAFLAGLVVAGSEYRHQALADMIPARELFVALFFVSVGMLLNGVELVERAGGTLAWVAAILVGKALVVFCVSRLTGASTRVALMSALALCQIGEFSFVLLNAGGAILLPPEVAHHLLVAAILTMTITPLLLDFGPNLISHLTGRPWWRLGRTREGSTRLQDHVVVIGYGLAGRSVSELLRDAEIPHVVLDSNPENVRAADHGVYGDATHHEILEELRVSAARLIVVCINDPLATEIIVGRLRSLTSAPVVARAQFEDEARALRASGAEVVSAETAIAQVMRALVADRIRDENDGTLGRDPPRRVAERS